MSAANRRAPALRESLDREVAREIERIDRDVIGAVYRRRSDWDFDIGDEAIARGNWPLRVERA